MLLKNFEVKSTVTCELKNIVDGEVIKNTDDSSASVTVYSAHTSKYKAALAKLSSKDKTEADKMSDDELIEYMQQNNEKSAEFIKKIFVSHNILDEDGKKTKDAELFEYLANENYYWIANQIFAETTTKKEFTTA